MPRLERLLLRLQRALAEPRAPGAAAAAGALAGAGRLRDGEAASDLGAEGSHQPTAVARLGRLFWFVWCFFLVFVVVFGCVFVFVFGGIRLSRGEERLPHYLSPFFTKQITIHKPYPGNHY